MNQASILVVFLALVLVGCGGGEPPALEAPAADAQAPEVAPAPVPADAESAPGEEALAVVEESAAEEDVQAVDQPILLAQADEPAASQEWKFSEGTHYARMVPTQPTVGGADKIEVAEIFWYGCNHCYDFEAFINRWKEDIPANVRFVRIPAVWNPLVRLHAQLYYTEEVLGNSGKIADPEQFRAAVFAEYHRRGNRLASVDAIQALFEKHGVSADDFNNTWNSFEVSQKLRVAQDLGRRYAVSGVPTVVVNGKYRTGAGEAGGYPLLLELIDELIARESIR
ncbi:MAG: DsbA family protein [Gammaproteobacteria bacterium]|nr:DsbA family protein [Gammaproteobacteria bacterium]MDH5345452.1 DsbA family protein [Gammaproteobacteria bacterium]